MMLTGASYMMPIFCRDLMTTYVQLEQDVAEIDLSPGREIVGFDIEKRLAGY